MVDLQQAREDRELAARVLKSLQAEVEHNLAALEPFWEHDSTDRP